MANRVSSLMANMPIPARQFVVFAIMGLMLAFAAVMLFSSDEPDPEGGPPTVRRLTEEQYRNAIADIFGPETEITGRFERPFRSHGLVAVGTGAAGISPFAVEQYEVSARGIAASVLSKKRRAAFLDCGPKNETEFDAACAQKFLGETGRLLFRRPLSQDELSGFVGLSRSATGQLGSFYAGLELGLYSMLIAPDFLFRIERVAAGNDGAIVELDAYSKAERLSFFLTNAPPDAELLDAAASGSLDGSWGVSRQVSRLMDSERYPEAVRSFFADMLEFDDFGETSKDPQIYPAFNSVVAGEAQEQTLKTIEDHLLENRGDYRDLFTLRDTFLTRSLGVIYKTPIPKREGWQAVRFQPDANRAGIQSHVAFLALHSHPGRSSPTLRGYAMRKIFLCQEVPDPPASVNFTAIEEHVDKANVTARDRLDIHSTEPSCAGCHKVMDPIGFALEAYDGAGSHRTHENGSLIDLSGDLDGQAFASTNDLAEALRNHPETPRCLAQRMYTSAVGRDITWKERYYLDWLIEGFADDDYQVPSLMERIATSDNFFAVVRPMDQPARRVAKNNAANGDGQ
ncbi:DUF1588 domain-containing protein [Pontixanthobacter aquaemixtae]|uniref:DUF1588 domain-containing protein n=1 Tax=Pontixanthobacter aquaemixtae TaxID=1958940 RepID=A0A844ZPW9_9SPHN|nr:DUF1588 domain-containing protein [Pontixanthobacter aquaemixtae]MXO89895.1 DUF1588 domain-containing protein [Pontixanthobacter aquaemixtae]